MVTRIERLYKAGKLDVAGVYNAVVKKIISPEDFETITDRNFAKYEENVINGNDKTAEEDNSEQ